MESTNPVSMKNWYAATDRASDAGPLQRTLPAFGGRFRIPGPPM